MEKNKTTKKLLAFLMAFTMLVSLVPSNVTMAATAKAVKSVAIKSGGKVVTKKSISINVGKTATLTTVVTPSAAKKSIAYKSSKPSVASVNAKGKVTGKKEGTAKITVTVTGKNKKKKTSYVNVNVKNIAVAKVSLDQTTLALKTGNQETLKATVTPSNATVKKVTWTTSDSTVATVTSKGVVKAVAAGTATITAKSGSKTAKCTVTVTNSIVAVTGVTVTPAQKEIAVPNTAQLSATITPADATDQKITWSSSDETVAIVTQEGVVTGISAGEAVITATTNDGKCTATSKITVTDSSLENAANAEIIVANSLKGFENTVLTGTNADVRVKVTNKKGEPLGNNSVELVLEKQYGNAPDVFGLTGDNNNYLTAKLTTDSNGYASFTVGLRGGYTYTSTDAIYESYTLTAKVTGSDVRAEGTLAFGYIDTSDLLVLNNRYVEYNDLVPGENASGWTGIGKTKSTDGALTEEYVSSQQVSTTKEDHKVYLSATPYIYVPAKADETKIGTYLQQINKSSGEYPVYNDASNLQTVAEVKGVPAGLKYASLYFSKMELSKYTALQIKTYDSVSGVLIKTYTMDADNMKDDFAYQIPVQDDIAVDLEVSLISEGQVNDDANLGFVIDRVEGLFKTDSVQEAQRVEVEGAVKWTSTTPSYSEYKTMTYKVAQKYIKDAKYLSENYKYDYEVPVFPATGDAIIRVRDENNTVLSYFVYPTENLWKNADGSLYPRNTATKTTSGGAYQNENEISDLAKTSLTYAGGATKASEEEVTQHVGTVTQDGNIAIVDSQKSGRTNLRADITIDGVSSSQFNETNGSVLYTSVEWAPIPEAQVEEQGDDFYALASQNIQVIAQLYDLNGNKVSTSGQSVTFSDVAGEITNQENATLNDNSYVTITSKEVVTNKDGQAVIQFKAENSTGYVYHLSAESKGYTVKLFIKNKETELANLYWVKPGLSFTDKASYVKGDADDTSAEKIVGTTTTTLGASDAQSVATIDSRPVGNHWLFGYQLVGEIDHDDTYTSNEVLSVDGLDILLDKSDDNETVTMTTEGLDNGVAGLYTEVAGSSKFTGTLGEDSFKKTTENKFVDDYSYITFTIVDENGKVVGTYKNVGIGDPSIAAKLELNISWTTSGKNLSIVYPNGTSLDKNSTTKAYIKVVDDYGNPIKNQEVTYNITGLNKTTAEKKATTNDNGLVEITLDAPKNNVTDTEKSTTITASADNGALKANASVSYTTSSDTSFGLVGAQLASSGDTKQIKLTFSREVNKNLLDARLFTVSSSTANVNNYQVTKAERGSSANVVILTLGENAKDIAQDAGLITVKVGEYTVNGINYQLTDSAGRYITTGYDSAAFAPMTTYAITLEKASATTVKVTIKDGKGADVTSALNAQGSCIAYSSVASVVGSGTGLTTLSSTGRTITVAPADADTTLNVYFCGASASITVDKQ